MFGAAGGILDLVDVGVLSLLLLCSEHIGLELVLENEIKAMFYLWLRVLRACLLLVFLVGIPLCIE